MNDLLELKTIENIKQYKFLIPSYQRGYRWTEKEVIDLLDDISDFNPKEIDENGEKTWYCLQPIVVKKRDEYFEVIDGQQRLTTIYLILFYLNQLLVKKHRKKIFELNYETRKGIPDFLRDLNEGLENTDNIDFYYISQAYNVISKWFERDDFNLFDFQSKFNFNTKVIWYESFEENPIAIFTRINIGKIPLTNAELIKALFLNSSNFDQKYDDKVRLKQLEIAAEWDRIEQYLQDDMLWYFINQSNMKTNRIDFIFELMNTDNNPKDKYSTFRFFSRKFISKDEKTIESNWLEVKNYFQRFVEWFNERELYHKIGFLIAEGEDIKTIIEGSQSRTKTEFKIFLNNLIKQRLSNVNISELQCGEDSKKIKAILLLYNIQTMLNNDVDNSSFPFHLYKEENWDIEHITSIRDKMPENPKGRENWLNDAVEFIDDKDLKIKVQNYILDDEFNEIYNEVISHFNRDIKDDDINDLSNLALLDSSTNRGYKNAVFPVKRMTIIQKEKMGKFIPLCTKNAFLKYFSEYPPRMSFWTQEDREKYYLDIESVLKAYLPEESEVNK
ncbi:DUF262 domain-containing protein [Gracilibacillus kekensis]|uniref:GmrSD restriction endonucleases N-terminal domain-containing protein n=1 Tax=Gracilibacillus kekensis TaxID=1027249 RepID=A0A1M7QQI4_9BACI|nr:DUF262 domain-containing protein [Gracilibacillus kekensis]SHN33788.1 Protein of unknown function DUF262 [Gracilibacillus kekensis]